MLFVDAWSGLADNAKGSIGAGVVFGAKSCDLQHEFAGDTVIKNKATLSSEIVRGFADVAAGHVRIIYITPRQRQNSQ